MKLFNDQATSAIANLDAADAAYCAKLEQRFAHMGISSKVASDAVCSLVEADAVPQVGIWAAPPAPSRASSLRSPQRPLPLPIRSLPLTRCLPRRAGLGSRRRRFPRT